MRNSSDGKELRISLLRTACYAAHPIVDRPIVPAGRFNDYIDMGQREFTFQFVTEKEGVDRQAQQFNEGVRALSFFPSGNGEAPAGMFEIREPQILLTAITGNEAEGYYFRVYNSSQKACTAAISYGGVEYSVPFGGFEVKRMKLCGGRMTQEERLA